MNCGIWLKWKQQDMYILALSYLLLIWEDTNVLENYKQ